MTVAHPHAQEDVAYQVAPHQQHIQSRHRTRAPLAVAPRHELQRLVVVSVGSQGWGAGSLGGGDGRGGGGGGGGVLV